MEKYKVSIIVAIYNSEPFIKKCIESIMNQTYKNIEIILVDDGSPDNSGKICDFYAKKDKRINVIHKKNGGACEARNYGLKVATGDYIVIVDGDDWLEDDYTKYLMDIIISTKADMALTKNVFTTRDRVQVEKDKISVWTPEEATAQLLYPGLRVGPWNKIYSAKLLKENNIIFLPPWSGEGLRFTTTVAQHSNKVGVGLRKIYNYRLNNVNSGLTNYNVVMGINALKNIKGIGDNLIIKTPMVKNALLWHTWKNYNFTLELIIATDSVSENKELYKECLKNIHKMMIKVFINSKVNKKEKMKIIIQSTIPVLYAKNCLRKKKKALNNDLME